MVTVGSFANSSEGKLTKKQEQTIETVRKICLAFSDKSKKEVVWRTWDEIVAYSGLSNGGVSKYFSKLISKGIIIMDRQRDKKGKFHNYYTYTGKSFFVQGKIGQTEIAEIKKDGNTMYAYVPKQGSKQPPSIPAARIYHNSGEITAVESGNIRRGRYKTKEKYRFAKPRQTENWYFVKDKQKNENITSDNIKKKEK